MAKKLRDAAKERFWRGVLKRFAASGLSVRAFCRRENLPESAFYFWRRELARRDDERPMCETRAQQPLSTFLPVRLTDRMPHEMCITVEWAGGRRLRFPEDIPAARLAEIVAAIEAQASHIAERQQ